MRITALLLILAALVAGCGDDDPAGTGESRLSLSVIGGDGQVVQAGSGRLPEPVVGRLVLLPSGRIAWSPLDLLARPAYAQTVAQGSPVPDVRVCVAPLTEGGPAPSQPCTYTDNDGRATFFFDAGTRAGVHVTELRASVEPQPAALDSVVTTIRPGPVVGFNYSSSPPSSARAGETLDWSVAVASGYDAYGNELPRDSVVSQVALGWAWTPVDTVSDRECDNGPNQPAGEGWVIPVPAEARGWVGRTAVAPNACLWTWALGQRIVTAIRVF